MKKTMTMKKKQVIKSAAKKAGKLVKVGHVDDIQDATVRADVKRRMAETKAAKKTAAALGLGGDDFDCENMIDAARVAIHAGLGVVMHVELWRDLGEYIGVMTWDEMAKFLGGTHRTIKGGELGMVFREVPVCLR